MYAMWSYRGEFQQRVSMCGAANATTSRQCSVALAAVGSGRLRHLAQSLRSSWQHRRLCLKERERKNERKRKLSNDRSLS